MPLCERGAEKRVTFENAHEFAELVLQMRLQEASEQVRCIRAGLATVVPVGCLSLWSWRDLELLVCGNPVISLEVLRKHTTYEGYQEGDAPVKYLWSTLESMGQADLASFVRFCWGRSRLPPAGSDQWEDGFQVCVANDIPEDGLPRAHTCFFQLDLPRYRSRTAAAEKILYAVRNCVTVQNS